MNKLIIAIGLTLISLNANALYLQNCYNHTSGNQAVSYSYQSCVNRNFRTIEREVRRRGEHVFLRNCSNIGNLVSYSFTSCINNNFRSVERVIRKPIFLNMCTNFNPQRLGYSFESCVTSNNRNLERVLR
jgi:hypothetical protein